MKRCLDVSLALVLLIILSLPMFIIACVVRIAMGRPVLFVQRRPGLHGAPFYLYKFRTMTNANDNSGEILPDELRMTTMGKILRRSSLDELPQLFNILKGELSFVGPRPLLMEYLPRYSPEQARRHKAKPGITGWAQVNGRNDITWEEKFKLDVWYVDHQNFRLDLKIIFMTIWKVLKREGINQPGQTTVEYFQGRNQKITEEQDGTTYRVRRG
ncbi:MAG: sugar transferase [Syntrophales bacterium]